jgi:hypothetical protein
MLDFNQTIAPENSLFSRSESLDVSTPEPRFEAKTEPS